MSKKHFNNIIQGLDEKGYDSLIRKAYEIGFKTWLGSRKVIVNKSTWYTHLHKGQKYGRMYFLDNKENRKGITFCNDFWFNNRWKDAKYDLAWLLERFWSASSWTPELV